MSNIDSLQKDLTRSIERLQAFVKAEDDTNILSVFAYTGALIDNYLQRVQDHNRARYHYQVFEREVNLYNQFSNRQGHLQIQQRNRVEIMREINQILKKYRHLKGESDENEKAEFQKIVQQKDKEVFDGHIRKIRLLYEEHNIDQAILEIYALREKAQSSLNIKQLMSSSVEKQLTKYQDQYSNMTQFYGLFEESDGWIFDKQEDNVKLEYKVFEEQRTIAVRMNAEIQIEMLPFLAIVCQIDLTKDYIPFVQVSIQKKDNFNEKPPRNLKIGFTLTSVPLLADRQCYYYAYGYDRIKTTGSIFILSKSFEDDRDFQAKYNYIVNHQDKVFLKVYYFCLEYKPISKTRAKVRIVSKANFQLTFLPLFILRLTARNFTFDYFTNIVKKAKTFKGSKWQEKVRSNPSMYNFFQSKIDQYFG